MITCLSKSLSHPDSNQTSQNPDQMLLKASQLAEKLARLDPSEYIARQTRMIHTFKLLETHPLQPQTSIHHPESQDSLITLDSPAMSIFTDFKSRPVETIHPDTSLPNAMIEMKASKVKSLIVVNDEGEILGLVSLKDIQGLKTGRMAQHHSLSPAELTISHIMTPAHKLETIAFKLLANARVGHIAKIIHEHDLQHLLVVDHDEIGAPKVRGIFSATRLARQLGIEAPLGTMSSHTFEEMHRNID
jgi:CBS domain-containing protein